MLMAAEAGDRGAMLYMARAFDTGVGLGEYRYLHVYLYYNDDYSNRFFNEYRCQRTACREAIVLIHLIAMWSWHSCIDCLILMHILLLGANAWKNNQILFYNFCGILLRVKRDCVLLVWDLISKVGNE